MKPSRGGQRDSGGAGAARSPKPPKNVAEQKTVRKSPSRNATSDTDTSSEINKEALAQRQREEREKNIAALEQEFLARQERARIQYEKLMAEHAHEIEELQDELENKADLEEKRTQLHQKKERKEDRKEERKEEQMNEERKVRRREMSVSASRTSQLMADVATLMAPKHPTKNVVRLEAMIRRTEERVKELEAKRKKKKKAALSTGHPKLGYEEGMRLARSMISMANKMEAKNKRYACSGTMVACTPEKNKEFRIMTMAQEKMTLEEIRSRASKAFQGSNRILLPNISYFHSLRGPDSSLVSPSRLLEQKIIPPLTGLETTRSGTIPGATSNLIETLTRGQSVTSALDLGYGSSVRRYDTAAKTYSTTLAPKRTLIAYPPTAMNSKLSDPEVLVKFRYPAIPSHETLMKIANAKNKENKGPKSHQGAAIVGKEGSEESNDKQGSKKQVTEEQPLKELAAKTSKKQHKQTAELQGIGQQATERIVAAKWAIQRPQRPPDHKQAAEKRLGGAGATKKDQTDKLTTLSKSISWNCPINKYAMESHSYPAHFEQYIISKHAVENCLDETAKSSEGQSQENSCDTEVSLKALARRRRRAQPKKKKKKKESQELTLEEEKKRLEAQIKKAAEERRIREETARNMIQASKREEERRRAEQEARMVEEILKGKDVEEEREIPSRFSLEYRFDDDDDAIFNWATKQICIGSQHLNLKDVNDEAEWEKNKEAEGKIRSAPCMESKSELDIKKNTLQKADSTPMCVPLHTSPSNTSGIRSRKEIFDLETLRLDLLSMQPLDNFTRKLRRKENSKQRSKSPKDKRSSKSP